MTASSRFIRARVVDFAGELAAEDVAGRRARRPRRRKIAAKLRRAKALRRRINRLRDKQPRNWEARVEVLKGKLRAVMADLRALGWKSPKPRKARRPGQPVDEADEMLEALPNDTPEEAAEKEPPLEDEGADELPEPEAETEGEDNWLDEYVGAEPFRPFRALAQRAGQLLPWGKPTPLGEAARIVTRRGQRAMVATVSPGLYIVQIVSDQAVKKLAGDNVGVLPLVLFPLVKNRILQKLARPPAQPGTPATPGTVPAAIPPGPAQAPVGCDACQYRSGR